MIDTLATLAREADPTKVYALNTARIEEYGKELYQGNDPQKQARAMFLRSEELLNSGRTEAAIGQFRALLVAVGGENPTINEHTKRIMDRIALSFLRLGEQQNCQLNHNAESCVFPFRGGGIHTNKNGSEYAIGLYTDLLRKYPNDLESRYLLNIAHMTLGTWPDGVPEEFRMPMDVLGQPHEDFPEFDDVGMANGAAMNGLSGGVVIADMNGDQRLDILASSYGFTDPLSLLIAQPEGGFRNEASAAGLDGITGGLNLVQADYDNDGDTDVLVLRGGWFKEGGMLPNSLLQNQGDGTFKDVTRSSGILSFFPTQTATWCDIDLDGWLDLVIGNEGAAMELFHNNGDGTFKETGIQAGLSPQVFAKGVTAGDYDNDGRIDLFVSVLGGANLLYHNDSEGSTLHFTEVASSAGVNAPFFSFPAWFWDYDQDGWLDIYVCGYDLNDLSQLTGEVYAEAMGYAVTSEKPRLFRNMGDGTFEDRTEAAGLDKLAWAMGSSFGDLDNNGFPDPLLATGAPDLSTLIPNQAYRNLDGKRFEEITRAGRFGHLQKGHGVGFADFDHDGDQDLYVVVGGAFEGDTFVNSLYRNPGTKGHWISLWLEGKAANRSALGARIEVKVVLANGQRRSFYHTVSPGGSFGGNSLRASIGLGDAISIESVEVTWPSVPFATDIFEQVDLDHTYRLIQGEKLEKITPEGLIWRESGTHNHH